MKKHVVWFDEVDKHDIPIVGGKGANLGEMFSAGFPVPFGFIVTSQAYYYLIRENNLEKDIRHYITFINFENPKELHDGSEAIRRLIYTADVPKDLSRDISAHYQHIMVKEVKAYKKSTFHHVVNHLKTAYKAPYVAVRSSATAEDLPDASFAGQQETFLNVQGDHDLMDKVKRCWASLFTERAMYYRNQKKYDHMKVGLAAVVQRMVQSDRSGIAFSVDPTSNDKTSIVIESIFGLGEYIVGGNVTPDHYEVSKKDFVITKKEVMKQKVMLTKRDGKNVELKLSASEGAKQKISDETVINLAKVVKAVEDHYFFPQDIEWAAEKDQVYIVQSRPITTLKKKKEETEEKVNIAEHPILAQGAPASPGMGFGEPVIIMSPDEIFKIKKGDVLVAPMTDPDYVPAMKRASAIVTELGGRTSHAAIVSRELGIPAVVGADGATKALAKEEIVTVDGSTGIVYHGAVHIAKAKHTHKTDDKDAPKRHLKTMTKIYLNLAEVELAENHAKYNVDGVGLMRAEFIMAAIGVHPRQIIKEGKQEMFIDTLVKNLVKVVKPFAPRPVVYRATDFKSNEYRHLRGGETFEPEEENPMLGFRGASRYLVWKDVFDMELEAIKRVRALGYKNLHLMIPFVRVPVELVQIKSMIREHRLDHEPSFKLWIMVEVPSAVILLDEFIKVGIDGISIGTNDLTMLMLGVDRDSHEVAHIYSEQNEAVLWALKKIVHTARKHNITVSVCGQAPSDYPDLAEKLVNWGVTSLSLNPDAVDHTRLIVHEAEKRLWHQSKK